MYICGLLITLYLAFKVYQVVYFKGEKFKVVKSSLVTFVGKCNRCNDSIVDLLKGFSTKEEKVFKCGKTIYRNAKKEPFKYVCRHFKIAKDDESLRKFETMLDSFETAQDGIETLVAEEAKAVESVKKDLPAIIRLAGNKRIGRALGFKKVEKIKRYYPRYVFKSDRNFVIVLDIDNLKKFVDYLSKEVAWDNSKKEQRALMTREFRIKILKRDGFTCQYCGANTKDNPGLLLEVDHIIPVSRGGKSVEENLQTLCKRCNRKKGAKIV